MINKQESGIWFNGWILVKSNCLCLSLYCFFLIKLLVVWTLATKVQYQQGFTAANCCSKFTDTTDTQSPHSPYLMMLGNYQRKWPPTTVMTDGNDDVPPCFHKKATPYLRFSNRLHSSGRGSSRAVLLRQIQLKGVCECQVLLKKSK